MDCYGHVFKKSMTICGAPQRSNLGPLFFSLDINDKGNKITTGHILCVDISKSLLKTLDETQN